MTDTATAPQTAPFETHVYVHNHALAHQHMREWAEGRTWLSEDAEALALDILETRMDQPIWGVRSPVVIRTLIEIIMMVEDSGDFLSEAEAVRRAAEQVLNSVHYPPIRRNMLREGLLALSDDAHVAKHRKALNKPLEQPELVAYLAGYFAQFIKDEERRVAHKLYELEQASA